MFQYLVVAWDTYYPCGGLRNIKSCWTHLEMAQEAAKELYDDYDNIEIYEQHTLECIQVVK